LYKIIVAGGRDFSDYTLLKEKLDDVIKFLGDFELICGMASGADMLGWDYAKFNNLHISEFPADWDGKGKAAGYIRNEDMAKYADACIVFWDGKSKGSKHMIDLAEKHGLSLAIIKYE